MSRSTRSSIKAPLFITVLFLVSLAGALLEGLWTSVPPIVVQFNGLLLLASALALLANGALTTTRRLRVTD